MELREYCDRSDDEVGQMDNQLLIKILLIAAIAVIGLVIVWPGRGARRLALRRLGLLMLIAIAAVAVLFPELSNKVANLVGVGRGADLLLYGLVIVFIGYVATARVHNHRVDVHLTELTRALAISAADRPGSHDK